MAGNDEISQIYRSGPTSARKDPSSIPNVSEAIASLNSTLEANSPREKRRCFFAPRLRRGQSSEPSLLTLEEVTPCFLLIGDLGLMTAVLCGAKERERERDWWSRNGSVRRREREIGGNIAAASWFSSGSVVVRCLFVSLFLVPSFWFLFLVPLSGSLLSISCRLHLENVVGEEDFRGWSVLTIRFEHHRVEKPIWYDFADVGLGVTLLQPGASSKIPSQRAQVELVSSSTLTSLDALWIKCLRGRKVVRTKQSKLREKFLSIYGENCQNLDSGKNSSGAAIQELDLSSNFFNGTLPNSLLENLAAAAAVGGSLVSLNNNFELER
ncbi:uncharacterized protein HKW66_Vig0248550 [Vigna angularis]|uniref:Uncharacterized protein n=1 Tax=Phaseolus angularis TaxID=3914 RepID=A0A8T0JSA4_PHAAN|nr:uncharacterized protein HKW66_Vig0248550 [Vigna angularis]